MNPPCSLSAFGRVLRRGIVPALLLAGLAGPLAAFDEEAALIDGLKSLRELNAEITAMAPSASEATVALISRGGRGAGSGVIVSKEGLILTAAHVVDALSDEIIVLFPDGTRKLAKPLGADFDRDAAMVQITDEGSYPHVALGDDEDLKRNQWCIALGHPGGFDPTRTPPVRLGRLLDNRQFLTSDCAVVSGDSGGPLFDIGGRLIGIHSNIGMTLSENRHVPISVYCDQWEDLKSGKRWGSRFGSGQKIDPDRPVLGVQLGEPAENGGVRVEGILDGSPASGSGIVRGDAVVAVAGKMVNTREELIAAVGEFNPGDEVEISYLHEGAIEKVDLKLARLGDLMKRREAPGRENAPADDSKVEEEDNGAGADERDALDRFLDDAIDRKSGKLKLNLSPEQLKEFGGMEKLQERLQERLGEMLLPGPAEANPEEPEEEAKSEEEVARDLEAVRARIRESITEGKPLEMRSGDLERIGGPAELQKLIRELIDTLTPEEREELARKAQEFMANSDKFFASTMAALQPIAKRTAKSTVTVLVGGEPVAQGTVVSRNGWILTKESETREGKVAILVGDEERPAELVRRFSEHDLALFKTDPEGLQPVRWARKRDELVLGEILTTAGEGQPLGIGLVSVKERPMIDIGYLGVQTADDEKGVLLERVLRGSAAAKAGLQKGDIVTALDGEAPGNAIEFGSKVRGHKAGHRVTLEVIRDEETRKIEVELGARPSQGQAPRQGRMSGRLSERVSGFPMVLQHDIPIDPNLCGSPLLDLNGRCVGINVSRAGRVKTYAVPAEQVRQLLASVKDSPEAAPAGGDETEAGDQVTPNELAEVRKLLQEVREDLKAVEELLEKSAR